jgi:hypothetical protein
MPYYQAGKIVYEKNRYKQKGGGVMQKYLRIFGQEGLGRPDLEASSEVEAINKFIKKNIPDAEIEQPSVALVFINDKAQLEIENAPVLTIPLKELKSTIRKTAKEKPLSPEMIKQINALFA